MKSDDHSFFCPVCGANVDDNVKQGDTTIHHSLQQRAEGLGEDKLKYVPPSAEFKVVLSTVLFVQTKAGLLCPLCSSIIEPKRISNKRSRVLVLSNRLSLWMLLRPRWPRRPPRAPNTCLTTPWPELRAPAVSKVPTSSKYALHIVPSHLLRTATAKVGNLLKVTTTDPRPYGQPRITPHIHWWPVGDHTATTAAFCWDG